MPRKNTLPLQPANTRLSLPTLLTVWGLSMMAILAMASNVRAQSTEGDQFLDGIGETALVARYVLAGDARDGSRNHHDASVHGAQAYVTDETFGRVLALGGGNGEYLSIPGSTLSGLDTVSVTGWVFYRSDAAWQRFFDFGTGTTSNFFCTPLGGQPADGYRARITTTGWNGEQGPVSQRITTDRWVHLAVVLNAANKTLTTYLDGTRAAMASDVACTLEDVLDQDQANSAQNKLFFGKSQYAADSTANVRLHDLRLYAIALSDCAGGDDLPQCQAQRPGSAPHGIHAGTRPGTGTCVDLRQTDRRGRRRKGADGRRGPPAPASYARHKTRGRDRRAGSSCDLAVPEG